MVQIRPLLLMNLWLHSLQSLVPSTFKVEFIVQSNCHWSASTITLLYAAIKNVQVDGQTCNLHCLGTCVLFLINVLLTMHGGSNTMNGWRKKGRS